MLSISNQWLSENKMPFCLHEETLEFKHSHLHYFSGLSRHESNALFHSLRLSTQSLGIAVRDASQVIDDTYPWVTNRTLNWHLKQSQTRDKVKHLENPKQVKPLMDAWLELGERRIESVHSDIQLLSAALMAWSRGCQTLMVVNLFDCMRAPMREALMGILDLFRQEEVLLLASGRGSLRFEGFPTHHYIFDGSSLLKIT